jgi:large subunit ribosomal protein L13
LADDEPPVQPPVEPAGDPPEAPKDAPKPRSRKPRAAKPLAAPASKETPPEPSRPANSDPAPKPLRTVLSPAGPPATVVDASGLVLGRAASLIAQRLLRGESIVVVNAERSVVVGARPMVLAFYRANRARGSKRTGPHYPRYPDRIFRRTVRGMLPHRKTRGRLAFERLRVYMGCPEGIRAATPEWAGAARARPALRPPIPLGEISKLLGARL